MSFCDVIFSASCIKTPYPLRVLSVVLPSIALLTVAVEERALQPRSVGINRPTVRSRETFCVSFVLIRFVIGELSADGRVGHGLVLAWFESYVLHLVF